LTQERFRTLTAAFYKGAHGMILVYDVTDEKTFANVRNWIRNIEQQGNGHVDKLLVGNKCDLDSKAVDARRGQELADDYDIDFFETSAKSNFNVERAFMALIGKILDRPGFIDDAMSTTADASTVKPNNSGGGSKDECPC
jgi:Ras-related protein Rab-8A